MLIWSWGGNSVGKLAEYMHDRGTSKAEVKRINPIDKCEERGNTDGYANDIAPSSRNKSTHLILG